MNEQSSRSHFVFTMRITGVNEVRKVSDFLGHFILHMILLMVFTNDEILVYIVEHGAKSARRT